MNECCRESEFHKDWQALAEKNERRLVELQQAVQPLRDPFAATKADWDRLAQLMGWDNKTLSDDNKRLYCAICREEHAVGWQEGSTLGSRVNPRICQEGADTASEGQK